MFYLKDLYPNMGFDTTTTDTIPEAEDKSALLEDGKQNLKADVSSSTGKKIGIGLAVIVITAVLLGAVK